MKLSIAANYLLSTLTVTNVTAQHLREAKRVSSNNSSEEWIHEDGRSKSNLAHVEDLNANNLDLPFATAKEDEINRLSVPRFLKKQKKDKKEKKEKKSKNEAKKENKKGKGSKKET